MPSFAQTTLVDAERERESKILIKMSGGPKQILELLSDSASKSDAPEADDFVRCLCEAKVNVKSKDEGKKEIDIRSIVKEK